jgi:hypothetical protein
MALTFDQTKNFIHQPSYSTGNELVWLFPEASGATFVANDAVIFSSGQLVVGTTGAVDLVGFSEIAATGTQGALVRVRVIRPTDVYVGWYQSDDTPAAADLNSTGFELIKPSAGVWRVDQDTTTNPKVLILGRANLPVVRENLIAEAASSAGGAVYCKFTVSGCYFGV